MYIGTPTLSMLLLPAAIGSPLPRERRHRPSSVRPPLQRSQLTWSSSPVGPSRTPLPTCEASCSGTGAGATSARAALLLNAGQTSNLPQRALEVPAVVVDARVILAVRRVPVAMVPAKRVELRTTVTGPSTRRVPSKQCHRGSPVSVVLARPEVEDVRILEQALPEMPTDRAARMSTASPALRVGCWSWCMLWISLGSFPSAPAALGPSLALVPGFDGL